MKHVRHRITTFTQNYSKCNFGANRERFVLLRNYIKLITMVSLCYKREKRIESQLSKLITAKPIYSDRVISCPAHLLSSAEFSLKLFSEQMLKTICLASAADWFTSKTKPSYEKTNKGDFQYFEERNVRKKRQILTSRQMSKAKLGAGCKCI